MIYSPNKVSAVTAESRLLEKPRNKFVVFHFMDVFLPQSAFTGESICNVR